jgi:S1-C subfamily serine protease
MSNAVETNGIWLTIRRGEGRGTSVRVAGDGGFVIGRDDECDLVLQDSKVSRRHASLVGLADGGLELRDLGASNGTFVNGARVEATVLRGREQIQVGDTVLASSLDRPDGDGSTVLGSAVFGRVLRPGGESAVHRLLLERSVRRATVLGVAGLVAAVAAVALYATGVLRPGRGESAAVERVVRTAAPSTVLIEAQRSGIRSESGTGWVLDARRGLIVTNAHVVNGGSTFRVGVADGFRRARVVGVAPCEDLAVLGVADARGLRTLPLGSQSTLELGETVVAVGYPANASAEASLTSTTGVVSVARTAYREPALDVPRYQDVVQTDAAINPGNSGGPLLDLDGRLVGVNSAGRTIAPDGRIVQGQNYAIGVDRVKEIARVLRTGRSIAWTGLGLVYPTPAQLREERLGGGLVVGSAVPGTPAAKVGLGRAGTVLLAANGQRLDNSLASYCDAVGDAGSGQKIALTVLQPGSPRPRRLTVAVP